MSIIRGNRIKYQQLEIVQSTENHNPFKKCAQC